MCVMFVFVGAPYLVVAYSLLLTPVVGCSDEPIVWLSARPSLAHLLSAGDTLCWDRCDWVGERVFGVGTYRGCRGSSVGRGS